MRRRVGLALVGAGAIAGAYADALPLVPEIQPVAWCDVNETAALDRAQKVGARSYASFEHMLRSERPDAVVIATPPNTHRDIALRALDAGCAVLCEKPFAPAMADAEAMSDAAQSLGRPIAMAAKFRHVPQLAAIRKRVAAGEIGVPLALEICFTANVSMRGRWNADPSVSGGGVIADNGAHAFDLVRAFCGEIETIRAVEQARFQGLPVEDTASLSLRCSSGIFATVDLSWSINKQLPYFLRVYGSGSNIEVLWKDYDKRVAFIGVLREFAAVTRGEAAPQVTHRDALATVAATQAAYASLETGSWSPAFRELVA